MLPPPAIKKDDKPLLSRRVKLLPYLGEEVLYVQFHLDEPWDSEHNKTLIPKMPAVLTSPYETAEMVAKGLTAYKVPICKGSLFDEDAPFNLAQARDGASHTILVVETNPDQAVPGMADRPVIAAAMMNATTPSVVTVLVGFFMEHSLELARAREP